MKYVIINNCLINFNEIIYMEYVNDKELLHVHFKNGDSIDCKNVGDDIFVQMQEAFNGD